MSETAAATENTPDGSLESAASAFDGILARQKADTQAPAKAQPEQVKAEAKAEPEPKQVPAAPVASESEQDAEGETPAPKLWKVKVDGEEFDVPEDELVKGYSRTADYTRKAQEVAKQRREFEEGELKAATTHRAQQQALLAELKSAIQSLSPVEPNWETLKHQLPAEQLAARVLEWNERKESLAKIDAEQTRLKAEETAEADKGFRAYVAEQSAHLERELPEFKDPEKGPALKKDLSAFAKSKGFTDDELSRVVDHRVVLLLHDAFQHQKAKDEAKRKAPEIKTKLEQAIEATPPSNRAPAGKKSEKDAAFARAAKSGDVRDAGKLFEHLI